MSLHDLPDWDERPSVPEDGEAWKHAKTTEACKAMYLQWQQVVYLLNGVLPDTAQEMDKEQSRDERYRAMIAANIRNDVQVVAVKMLSSEVVNYVGRMENAAIIRKCAQDIAISLWSLKPYRADGADTGLDEGHRKVLRTEIDKFRALFKEWIGTFRKDENEFEDEWGLFV